MADEDVIQHQMEQTRQSLADKLETLEQKVAGTVDTVTETVQAVTDTVQETVQTVTGAVQGTVESVTEGVKNVFDVRGHVRSYPWAMVGGSVAVGFLLGSLLGGRRRREAPAADHAPAPAAGDGAAARERTNGKGHHPRLARHGKERRQQEEGWFSKLTSTLGPQIETLKSLALGTTLGLARDMLTRSLPESLKHEVSKLMNDATSTLGGRPIHEPVIEEEPQGVRRGGLAS
jgi:ElaB/YqjD/DUF883 family membrane-anchored ribosome-binding protein